MTKINLLPPEILDRQKARRNTTLVAAGGLLVVVLLFGFWFMKHLELQRVQEDIEAQQAVNASLQQQVDELSRFDEILAEIADKEDLLASLLQNEVRWSGVLRDISLVIPNTAWLRTMQASLVDNLAGTVAAPTTGGANIVGSISFEGVADRHPTVAEWLTALEKIRGFINPWVSQSSNSDIEEVPIVNFSSTVDLSVDVTVEGRSEQ